MDKEIFGCTIVKSCAIVVNSGTVLVLCTCMYNVLAAYDAYSVRFLLWIFYICVLLSTVGPCFISFFSWLSLECWSTSGVPLLLILHSPVIVSVDAIGISESCSALFFSSLMPFEVSVDLSFLFCFFSFFCSRACRRSARFSRSSCFCASFSTRSVSFGQQQRQHARW